MNFGKKLNGEAEYDVCIHCDVPIIRWPNRPPEYASPSDKRWIHDPPKGFRLYMCKGIFRDTMAEPGPR